MQDRTDVAPGLEEDPRQPAQAGTAALGAYWALERMIVTLELPPEATVTERALIERLGLGRTPVREAVQRLAWEGLMIVRPRTGLQIAPLRAGDWLRVLDARRGVECVLARSAARLATRRTATRLQEVALAMHEAVVAGDGLAFLDADRDLDMVLAETADNAFAVRLAAPLQSHSRRFWFHFQCGTGLAESAASHVAMIGAIIARDEERAAAAADHLLALLRLNAQVAAMRR